MFSASTCVQQGWAINIVVAGVHAAPSSDDTQPQKMRQLKPPQVYSVLRCLIRHHSTNFSEAHDSHVHPGRCNVM